MGIRGYVLPDWPLLIPQRVPTLYPKTAVFNDSIKSLSLKFWEYHPSLVLSWLTYGVPSEERIRKLHKLKRVDIVGRSRLLLETALRDILAVPFTSNIRCEVHYSVFTWNVSSTTFLKPSSPVFRRSLNRIFRIWMRSTVTYLPKYSTATFLNTGSLYRIKASGPWYFSISPPHDVFHDFISKLYMSVQWGRWISFDINCAI